VSGGILTEGIINCVKKFAYKKYDVNRGMSVLVYTEKNNFVEIFKIELDIDLKIILLDKKII